MVDGMSIVAACLHPDVIDSNQQIELRAVNVCTEIQDWVSAHCPSWIDSFKNADPRSYDPQDPYRTFSGIISTKDSGLEVSTKSLISVMIRYMPEFLRSPTDWLLSHIIWGKRIQLTALFPFRLPLRYISVDLYVEKYFGTTKTAEADSQLFGTAFGFTKACQMGSIGINAYGNLKGLREFIEKGKYCIQ